MLTHRRILRTLPWKLLSRKIRDIAAIPVLTGPLRGKLLPEHPALEQPSMLFGLYEQGVVFEVIRLTETTRTAYDIGANIGYITLALACRMGNGGRIYAFEPAPRNVDLLNQLVALNNIEKMVHVLSLAVGETTGEQRLIMLGSSSMHFLETATDGQDTSLCHSVMVESTTLDSFVLEQNNPAPDFVKIDVEGAEALVLQGALRTLEAFSPTILIEIHGPTNARMVWEVLDTLNYSWVKLTEEGQSVVATQEKLLPYFTKDSWTHHFLLTKD